MSSQSEDMISRVVVELGLSGAEGEPVFFGAIETMPHGSQA